MGSELLSDWLTVKTESTQSIASHFYTCADLQLSEDVSSTPSIKGGLHVTFVTFYIGHNF